MYWSSSNIVQQQQRLHPSILVVLICPSTLVVGPHLPLNPGGPHLPLNPGGPHLPLNPGGPHLPLLALACVSGLRVQYHTVLNPNSLSPKLQ